MPPIEPDPRTRPDDGSDGSHYDIRLKRIGHGESIETQDLIEALDLNHAYGEMLCAIVRSNNGKRTSSRARDLRKIIYYAQRQLQIEEGK